MTCRRAIPLLSVLLTATPASAMSDLAAQGRRVVEEAQCTRCHAVTDIASATRGVKAARRALHCVDCHNWILDTRDDPRAIARWRRKYPDWDRYLDNIVHFTAVPDLGTLTRRVDPAFIRGYLDAPFDLRPHLDETMLHPRINVADKDAVAAYLAELAGGAVASVPEGPVMVPTAERVAAGRDRFANLSCPTCHVYGSLDVDRDLDAAFYEAIKDVAKNAPNLRFVRDRIPRHILVRHILDPRSVDPLSRMPKQVVSPEDTELLADFLLFGDPQAASLPEPKPRPEVPVLSRRVSYDEVFDEVFGRICVHCHMNRAKNGGEGGPGNSGGLGFAAIEIDLQTYRGMRRGLLRDGERVSILDPQPESGAPLVLESLLRRYDETAADPRDPTIFVPPEGHRPGMPMALPPLTVAQLSLVKTWLENGGRGPKAARLAMRAGARKRGKRRRRR